MKTTSRNILCALVALCALLGSTARANTINLTVGNAFFINQAAEPNLATLLAGVSGSVAADFSTVLYKNSSGVELGTLASNYTTTYSIPNNDGDATISWDGPAFADATYLMAKDGNMGIYIWDVSAWNGKDSIFITNPWLAGQGKRKTYSHITFWGTEGTNVPDGGTTAILVGGGLIALGLLRRKLV